MVQEGERHDDSCGRIRFNHGRNEVKACYSEDWDGEAGECQIGYKKFCEEQKEVRGGRETWVAKDGPKLPSSRFKTFDSRGVKCTVFSRPAASEFTFVRSCALVTF